MFTELKCPRCGSLSHSSGGGMSTLMYCAPYTDKDGVYHHNDLNTHTSYYQCLECHLNFYTERRGDYFKVGFYEEPEKIDNEPLFVEGLLTIPKHSDKLVLNKDGEFVTSEMPAEFCFDNNITDSIDYDKLGLYKLSLDAVPHITYNDIKYRINLDKLIELGLLNGILSKD